MRRVVQEQQQTLIMVTHDNHLASFADRIFHIKDGKIINIEDNRKNLANRNNQKKETGEEPGEDNVNETPE